MKHDLLANEVAVQSRGGWRLVCLFVDLFIVLNLSINTQVD